MKKIITIMLILCAGIVQAQDGDVKASVKADSLYKLHQYWDANIQYQYALLDGKDNAYYKKMLDSCKYYVNVYPVLHIKWLNDRTDDSIRIYNEKIEEANEKKQAQRDALQQKKNDIANVEKQKQRKIKLTQKYGQVYGELIFNHKVKIGMTSEMCIESWGKPIDNLRTTTAYGLHEQWVYNTKTYLYFDDGILTTIQN